MHEEIEVIAHEKDAPGSITKLVTNLKDTMRDGLRRRKASSSATQPGRVQGFKSEKEEATFSDAIDKACRELEDMMIGNRRANRTVTPSGMVVWREHDPTAQHDAQKPTKLSRAGIWRSYQNGKTRRG